MIIRANRISEEWQKEATALEKKFGCIYILASSKTSLNFAVRAGEGGRDFVPRPNIDNAPEGIELSLYEGIVTAKKVKKKSEPKPEPKSDSGVETKKIDTFPAPKSEKKKRKEL